MAKKKVKKKVKKSKKGKKGSNYKDDTGTTVGVLTGHYEYSALDDD